MSLDYMRRRAVGHLGFKIDYPGGAPNHSDLVAWIKEWVGAQEVLLFTVFIAPDASASGFVDPEAEAKDDDSAVDAWLGDADDTARFKAQVNDLAAHLSRKEPSRAVVHPEVRWYGHQNRGIAWIGLTEDKGLGTQHMIAEMTARLSERQPGAGFRSFDVNEHLRVLKGADGTGQALAAARVCIGMLAVERCQPLFDELAQLIGQRRYTIEWGDFIVLYSRERVKV